jgi:hypothetical protein
LRAETAHQRQSGPVKSDSLQLDCWFDEGPPPPGLMMPAILKAAGFFPLAS